MIENKNKAGWKKDFQSRLNYLVAFLFFPLLAIFASTISTPVFRKAGQEFGVAAEKIIPRSSVSSRGSQSQVTSLGERIGCSIIEIEEVFLSLKKALQDPHFLKALEERCQLYDMSLMTVKVVQSDSYRFWMEPLITSPSQQLGLVHRMSGSFLEKAERDIQHCLEDRSEALKCEMRVCELEKN